MMGQCWDLKEGGRRRNESVPIYLKFLDSLLSVGGDDGRGGGAELPDDT